MVTETTYTHCVQSGANRRVSDAFIIIIGGTWMYNTAICNNQKLQTQSGPFAR